MSTSKKQTGDDVISFPFVVNRLLFLAGGDMRLTIDMPKEALDATQFLIAARANSRRLTADVTYYPGDGDVED